MKKRAATSSLPPSRTLGGVKPPPSVSVGGGFKNRGADCFVIAVVQALVCLDPFINRLYHNSVCCELLVEAASNNDIELLLAVSVVSVIVVLVTQLISDIGYVFLNPRIRIS